MNVQREPRVFLGFRYADPYLTLYGEKVARRVREHGWRAIMPLGEVPQGLLLDRIAAMIRGADRAVYEVGESNGNVWFELGISLGWRQPVALATGRSPSGLPDILRSPWLSCYANDESCLAAITGFLDLAEPVPMVQGTRAASDISCVTVVGSGERAEATARALRDAGRLVTEIAPGAIRSMLQAVATAESCGALVVVRPSSESWSDHEAVGPILSLGAGYALGRKVILAAADTESVVSDCTHLAVRGSDDRAIAAAVRARVDTPPTGPLPSGTTRPRLPSGLTRPQAVGIATVLRETGQVLLDAEPGYGKTTLLGQIADILGWPTAWLTIESDWSAAELLDRLVMVVGEHAPGFGWSALASMRAAQRRAAGSRDLGPNRQQVTPEAVAEHLVSDADRVVAPDHVLLVVDDLHKATPDGGRLLARLLTVKPAWLSIALAGRGVPSDLGRMSANGALPTWRAADVRFSLEETTAYLQAIPGEGGVERARVELLHGRTGGWQAALAVIRAWLVTRPDVPLDRLREMVRGDRQQIYRMFAADYFSGLEPALQQDLFSASLPGRLEPEVSRHLLGVHGSRRLRELADGPYFLVEEGGGAFRMHSLFREFLGQRWIEDRGRESLKRARAALGRWYLQRQDPANAYQMSCEAEDWDTATAALEPIIRSLANGGDAPFVLDLLARMPESRIRASRPIWESWVRALTYTGSDRALAEARRLAASSTEDSTDQALADLLLAEARYERGELTDASYAEACDAVATRLGAGEQKLGLQARHLSLTARAIRSTRSDEWPRLRAEALALADAAESAGIPAVAAIARATAGDMGSRIFETTFSSEVTEMRFAQALGYEVPMAVRAQRAREFIELSRTNSELYRQAFALAEDSGEPSIVAHVQISFSRFLTLNVANSVLRSGVVDEATRAQGEQAISLACQAANTYGRYGIQRSVAIALNAAAEAAAALDDPTRRNGLCDRSAAIARQYGYDELAETAARIRTKPTARETHEAASNPPPFHRLEPAQRETYIEEMLRIARAAPPEAEQVRDVLRLMMAAEVQLDAQREEVCKYLALLKDLRGPKIGPFDAVPPTWSVTCRMRGLSLVTRHRQAGPLLRQFVSASCWACEFRSPGATGRGTDGPDTEIYAPMLARLASEGRDLGR